MEKYYTVTPDSKIYNAYVDYRTMLDKVNAAFTEFAKEQGFETKQYYPKTDCLCIVPTNADTDKFGKYFKKDMPGMFKKTSLPSKAWISKCSALGLKTPHKPNLVFYMNVSGRASCRMFMIDDVLYASYETNCDFESIDGLNEIKASEFYKVIEEYEESLKNK